MKIPETSNPFKVIVNGVEKNYEAGATVSDDASVKEIIAKGNQFPPDALPVETPFPIPEQSGGTSVEANPTLAGTEDSLTGIQIGETKYAVGGGGGGVLVVNIIPSSTDSSASLDKTWQEIHDAPFAVFKFLYGESQAGFYFADSIVHVENLIYSVTLKQLASDSTSLVFQTDSPNGYPTANSGE